jgi:hypothetical protein
LVFVADAAVTIWSAAGKMDPVDPVHLIFWGSAALR